MHLCHISHFTHTVTHSFLQVREHALKIITKVKDETHADIDAILEEHNIYKTSSNVC